MKTLQTIDPLDPKVARLLENVFSFDHGYSGMKFNGSISGYFPTYVLPHSTTSGSAIDPLDNIVYTDETGAYDVGNSAYNRIKVNASLFDMKQKLNRTYFKTRNYLIAYRTAVAVAYPNKNKFRIPVVVTGLPSSYMDDEDDLENIIRGTHKFQLTYGGHTRTVEFFVDLVLVVPQPYGTLCLFAYDRLGNIIREHILRDYTQIHDWGFYTTDIQLTLGGITQDDKCLSLVDELETTSKCYDAISKKIKVETGQNIPIIMMREVLQKGYIKYRKQILDQQVLNIADIANPIFEEATKNVLTKVIQNDSAVDIANHILTGGGAGYDTILSIYKQVYEDLLYPQMDGIDCEPDMANTQGYKNLGMNTYMSILQEDILEQESSAVE